MYLMTNQPIPASVKGTPNQANIEHIMPHGFAELDKRFKAQVDMLGNFALTTARENSTTLQISPIGTAPDELFKPKMLRCSKSNFAAIRSIPSLNCTSFIDIITRRNEILNDFIDHTFRYPPESGGGRRKPPSLEQFYDDKPFPFDDPQETALKGPGKGKRSRDARQDEGGGSGRVPG
jgi:hypothetical protein